ncbi:VOC family protein [Pseudomonas benzenivorans]|uniref:VOC family protein n=1 Tax=Pseudomonas benzenivorans TaxID=556533 RepID=A0ABY5H0N9_9PSED|nr:VOC family protein [Pseudomonas benzenivorans]UTW05818.1 VOC family protein [Pseudomonas benzenivorans]
MNQHDKLNYVEFPAKDLAATKAFFQAAFGWVFTDYGPEYTAFADQGLDGGFFKSELCASQDRGSALMVFYSAALEETQAKVERAGGRISKAIFAFPGGRRFHFIEPSGNEFAAWSDIGD